MITAWCYVPMLVAWRVTPPDPDRILRWLRERRVPHDSASIVRESPADMRIARWRERPGLDLILRKAAPGDIVALARIEHLDRHLNRLSPILSAIASNGLNLAVMDFGCRPLLCGPESIRAISRAALAFSRIHPRTPLPLAATTQTPAPDLDESSEALAAIHRRVLAGESLQDIAATLTGEKPLIIQGLPAIQNPQNGRVRLYRLRAAYRAWLARHGQKPPT